MERTIKYDVISIEIIVFAFYSLLANGCVSLTSLLLHERGPRFVHVPVCHKAYDTAFTILCVHILAAVATDGCWRTKWCVESIFGIQWSSKCLLCGKKMSANTTIRYISVVFLGLSIRSGKN